MSNSQYATFCITQRTDMLVNTLLELKTMLPEPPNVTEEDLEKCRSTGDYCPVLFEWYKFTSGLCVTFANLQRNSPALRSIHKIEYSILVGLINRIARLMLSNVHLSFEGGFGETTAIIDRCIFESCITLSWLCRTNKDDRFNRYMAGGLRTELELKKHIEKNISDRNNEIQVIEERMLGSIKRCIDESGLTENEIEKNKKIPDLAAMLEITGRTRLEYTVGQRLGSHHIHGTWVSLLFHYLEKDNSGTLKPRGHNCPTHVNQYVYTPIIVLDALTAFVEYVFSECDERNEITGLFNDTLEEIHIINDEVVGDDFTTI